MSSNVKPKPAAKEAPNEPFKRAVTGCLRAIARQPELEVSFAAERPGVAGGKARLPEPPRKLTREDAAIVRGHADSIALRMACHDAAIHRKLTPNSQQGRAVFEAVEFFRLAQILGADGLVELRIVGLVVRAARFVGAVIARPPRFGGSIGLAHLVVFGHFRRRRFGFLFRALGHVLG
jgi:hypothetical protein